MKWIKTVGRVMLTGVLLAVLFSCDKADGPVEQAGEKIDQALQEADATTDTALDKIDQQIEQTGENIQEAADDAGKLYL